MHELSDDPGIMASSSHGTTASASSTAPSLSYLTPASSVGGFKHRSRQMTENNPYITGTVQPYLRKPPKTGNSRMGTTSSQTHKGGLVSAVESFWLQRKSTPSASSFSTAWSIPRGESSVRQATLSLSRKTSSSVSFKTAKSASVPALEPMRQLTVGENLQTITSEKPRLTPVVVTVSSSASGDQQDLDEKNSNTESLSTQSSSAAGNTTSEAAAAHDQRLSTASSKVDLRPSTAGPQLDTSITSSVLTASTPPTRAKSHSSSGVLAAGGVRMNQETQTSAVSPTTLNHLWSQFLAGHLRGGESNTTTKHSPSVAYSETGVQTTPSLGTNKFPSHPVLSPEVEQTPPPTRFSQLTLQESLKTLRPDFVHRSEQRQRELRRNRDLRNRAHCRAATELLHHPHTRPATARERGKSGRSPHFVLSKQPL